MRVCHVWMNFPPLKLGGVERYIMELSGFLSQQDKSMHFLMITDKSNVKFLYARKLLKRQMVNSIEVHRLGPNLASAIKGVSQRYLRLKSRSLDNFLIMGLYREAASIREIKDVDIFHVHGFWETIYPTIGLLLSQRFHRPVVVSLHGDSASPVIPFSMPIWTPERLWVLRKADAIITSSTDVLNSLEELGLSHKSHLVPNFVNSISFKRPSPTVNNSGNRAVTVSRLDPGKDEYIATLIRAFAYVRKEVPEAALKIVGDGPSYEKLARLIRYLCLEDAITMVGSKEDVRKFLWESDIFVGPRAAYIATLEAWAAGVAVVASAETTLKDIVSDGENGLLVSPFDVKHLSSAITRLMLNREVRATLAANGLQAVRKHDIHLIAPQISEIYRYLIEK